MENPEHIEKIRQEIMRFRELLTIMRGSLESGERAYEKLFAAFSAEDRAAIKEKDLQLKIAEAMTPEQHEILERGVMNMRFTARDLEQNFEQLHDTILTPIEDEDA